MCKNLASEFYPKKLDKNNIKKVNNIIDITENPMESAYAIKYDLLKEKHNIMNKNNSNNIISIINININNNINNSNNNNLQIIEEESRSQFNGKVSTIDAQSNNNKNVLSEIEFLKQQVKAINSTKKVVQKKIEIFTTVTYRLEDGTTRTVREVKTHIING
jgi:uncharacterized protein YfbU (UPF0304 family)